MMNKLIIITFLLTCCVQLIAGGCRNQESRACESICTTDLNGALKCEVRGAVILPSIKSKIKVEASLEKVFPVIELADLKVQADKILPDFIKFNWTYYDDKCDSALATINVIDAYKEKCSHFIIGPSCDFSVAAVSRIAKYFYNDGLNIVTAGGYTYDFEEPKNTCDDQFYMLHRVGMLSFEQISKFVIKIMENFNWENALFLYDREGNSEVGGSQTCHLMMSSVAKSFREKNLKFSAYVLDMNDNDTNVRSNDLRREAGNKHGIIIMCANPKTIREIMIAADELNMIDSGEYVFFNIEIFGSLKKDPRPWFEQDDNNDRNEKAKKAYQALLTITTRKPEDEEYQKFSDEVKKLALTKYNYTFNENEQISQFVSAFYDAVLLFANALNDSIQIYGENALVKPLNGTRLTQLMWKRSFRGITGNVSIDANGDRLSEYSLLDMDPDTSHFEVVAVYHHDNDKLKFIENKKIHWTGGRIEAPADRPECGFDNSLCPPDDSSAMFAILSMVLGLVVIILSVVSIVSYRHYRLEAEISSMTWKINWNEVIPVPTTNQIRGSIHSRTGSQLSIYSEEMMGDRQVFIPIGCYKGNTVAIKKITVPITLTRSLLMELKTMKDIQHDHLVRFYGCVIDSVPCILTEYCPKGSLQDILENHEINLDWMFKLSLMHDIVKGMSYLHTTPIHSHGQLKSSNCVVDSRFVLKITDFGLHDLRRDPSDESENKESHEYWKKYLWTAPELLRANNYSERGTQKGDIYSFAIIVQEICCRQGVFYLGECDEKTPREITQLVSSCPIYPNEPFRPNIDNGKDSCCDVNNLMMKCWSEDPIDRPDFSAIKSMVRKINKENESGNILDNLLKRMEHYAQNLESLVDERTRDYLDEKRKCEELLYQLLPVSIASQLIEGKPIVAEMFDQVTIYFSDIVGFTSISAESTPMQVVDLLNDLYTCFDKILGHFDVYKVETIGDAYMVVSGLPQRNGDSHAREIARMALALLNKVHNFIIRHRPDDKLKLRIGLHSGPCCAGVVGLKMPRYCLFGDTVNTASRMESNGEPLKIHISNSTKQILDKFGTFDVTSRGYVAMKGKGEMLTYWLNGEKSPEELAKMSLPTIETSHHHFTNNNNNSTNLNNNNISNHSSTQHINHHDKDVKLLDVNHVPEEKPNNTRAIAVVPPLTPQNSFNSKNKNVTINASLRNNLSSYSSLKDLSHQPLLNGKKPSLLKKKQINFNNEKHQPLLSAIK
ncbi:unnamed protein product [Chironomus riparius]|uniref:Guanylate cyclase n=1 Tax=Chironomus riparius TaxID=315576 RepID=A0A9N9RY58_9DIPT|nr:unnamed protein product [Chironomus riparius]